LEQRVIKPGGAAAAAEDAEPKGGAGGGVGAVRLGFVLHEKEPCSLRNISGWIVKAKIRLNTRFCNLRKDLPMLIFMELVSHHPVVTCKVEDFLNHGIA